MTLRSRINLIVASLTLLFVAAIIVLQLRSMRESVHEEVVAANLVAMQLLQRNAMLYGAQGMPAILAYLQGVGRVRSNDIVLYDDQGRVLYRSPPSRYKAGRDAPDWFDALIAPPPSVQAIAFPGGRLVTETNASRAAIDAWDYMTVLCGGAAVMLVVVNALVFWLVGRTARPFAQIATALDEVEAGRLDVALPPLPGTEARLIGAAFNRMVVRLQANLETERRLADNRELNRWLEAELEQERRRIARELHDELGQSVTAMHSMAVSITQRLQGTDPQAEQAARLIAEESTRLYEAMHSIVPRLAPLVLDRLGLADALADLAERTRRSQPALAIELELRLGDAPLEGDTALALYRGAQEAVTNALRHGQATYIRIVLDRAGDTVTLTVADNGRGLPPDAAPAAGHHGLRWLAERAEGLGGHMKVANRAGGGVELRMELSAR